MIPAKNHTVWHTINAAHVASVFFFRLVGKLLKTIISLDISGSRHGMKLKLSPKKLFGKRWPLVMSLRGSYDKRIFYRVKNKS